MKAVGHGQLFEVQPEAFNRIEERTVFGKPDHQQAVFVQAQRRFGGLAVVVGRVVHHDHQLLARVFGQQMLEESDERFTVLAAGGGVRHLQIAPVVGPEDVQMLRRSRCRDERTLTALHPAAPQGRMQAHRRFVHKEELGFGDGVERDVFFSHAVTCSIVSWTGRSCR